MATENEPYHYNYQALDNFLASDFDPKELGNQLDELMADLVYLAKHEDDFGTSLSDHLTKTINHLHVSSYRLTQDTHR